MTSVETATTPVRMVTAADVAAAAQLACLLEASAPKPGNVSPGRHFTDTRYEDFLASAVAIGEPLAGAGERGIGATVRLAVEATRRWTGRNTNLGIVLLLAPLAKAALCHRSSPEPQVPSPESATRRAAPSVLSPEPPGPGQESSLRASVREVLDTTTIDDAREVYAAIRLASPGGLGQAGSQDVTGDPDVTLLEAMRLAAHRDSVAREYATAFDATFGAWAPTLEQRRRDGLSWDDAIVETFLTILAANPDTHIARRAGIGVAQEVTALAQRTLGAGGVRSTAGKLAIERMDSELRDARNLRNPGTTADLVTAAIFIVLLGGRWR